MKKLVKVLLIAGGILLGLLALGLGAAAVIIPMKFPPEKLKAMAVEASSKALNRKVSIGSVKFNILKGFQITELKIPNRAGWAPGNFVSAKEISISYKLLPLIFGRVSLGEIRLERPQVLIENRGKAGFNFSDMKAPSDAAQNAPKVGTPPPSSKKGSGGMPFALTVDSLNILHAKVAYLDASGPRPERTDLPDLNLKVRNISLDGGRTTLSLSSPFTFEKMTYQLKLDGAARYDLSAQSVKDMALKGDVSGVGFEFSGSAKHLADNFSPDIKGSASLEMIKTIGLLPKSLASMPQGLELKGPAKVDFTLGGSLNEGLELNASAEGEGMYVRYKDLFLKESKMPMRVQFKSVKGKNFFKVPSYQAVFKDWAAKGSFAYINDDSYNFSLKTESMPIAGLSGTVPRWKDIRFGGAVAIDASGGQKLGNDKSFVMKGRFGLKDIAVSHPKEPKFLEGLTCSIDMTQNTFKVPEVSFRLLGTSAKMTFSMDRFHALGPWDLDKLNAGILGTLSTANDLDLERFMTVFASADAAPSAKADKKPAASKDKKPASAKDSNWVVGPGMTASIRMNFKSFTYRKLKFENVAFTSTLAKRLMQSKATVNGFGGSGTGALNMTLAGVPGYSFALGLKGVSAQRTVNDTVESMDNKDWLSFKDKYHGNMDFDFKGTFRGTTVATMEKSLLGSGAATMTGAKLKGYSFIKTMNGVFKDKSDEIKFDTIKASLSVKDTILSFAANTLGKVGAMRATGGLRITDWWYHPDMKIQCDVKKEFLDSDALKKVVPSFIPLKDLQDFADVKGNVPLDIKFTGKASENNYAWDWQGRFAKNRVDKGLRDLGDQLFKPKPKPAAGNPPAAGAPTPGTAPAQGAAPAPTKKPALNDLLKGIKL